MGDGVGDGVGEGVGVMTTVELPEAVKTGVIDTSGKTLEVCPTGMRHAYQVISQSCCYF